MEKYGDIYKSLRKRSGMTIGAVVDALGDMGINVTTSAMYNYENNIRAASAEIMLALCKIYKCHNILETFAGAEPDYSRITDEEWTLVEKYRALDDRGKINVIDLLNREYSFTEESKKGSIEEDFA